jgi:hypothetical protein
MSAHRFHLTARSANAKTGPIVVTTSTAKTCPPACPFSRTCYAKGGPLALHWRAVTTGERGAPWRRFLADLRVALDQAPRGQVWRHNQAGDLPGAGDRIDAAALEGLVAVNAAAGARGFTYTHKPLIPADAPAGAAGAALARANLDAVVAANAAGLTINASANNLAHVDALADALAGRAPVVVVVAADAPETIATPAGRKVVVCPAQTRAGVTCATCRLCSRADRKVVVGFRAHGTGARHFATEGGAR